MATCHQSPYLHKPAIIIMTVDVKWTLKIRTSNKTFEFRLVFKPFDVHLLTAFCRMPLFIFDYDCVDHSMHMQSGRCCCDVRFGGCDRSFLLAVAGSRGWRPCDVGDRCRRVGTCGKVKPWDHATRCRHLCGPTLSGGGKERSGWARRMS